MAVRMIDRFCVAVAAGAGLCGAALALSPGAVATPFATGGAACMEQQAGFGAAPLGAAPVVLPGPIPVAPVVPVVPPVPLVPPAPAVVPPVPPAVPVVPIAGAGAGAGVADGAPPAAPITMNSGTGKGAPVAPPPTKAADPVVLPGPAVPAQPQAPIPAVLAGSTTALPACAVAGVN
ncbi:hypothetical protein A5634_12570 [Mycobacterium asiaticum]|uniref:Beta-xylosidase n=2 Tax=Mycobacterium asiaticum TaxID=1790 RepID=A0A1A3NHL9_MYCAS|nr:hypothetical protein A5634_12570 [Mycobacterium asiaticum]